MMKILTTTMMTSISEVLETMCYLPVEFRGEQATLIQGGLEKLEPTMACQLKFSGDVSGCLTLVIPEDLLAQVTENFMGEPMEKLEKEHLSGTLTEILNMICGNALSKVEAKIPFELDIPEMIDSSGIPSDQLFTIIETPQSLMAMNINTDGLT